MSEPIEHLGLAATHPKEWREGITCVWCQDYLAQKRTQNVSPDISPAVFGSVLGGASPGAARKQHEQTFNADMHAYREARRAGEKPERTDRAAIRENRQRHEVLERVVDQGKVEVIG